jgi:hypothetical protein
MYVSENGNGKYELGMVCAETAVKMQERATRANEKRMMGVIERDGTNGGEWGMGVEWGRTLGVFLKTWSYLRGRPNGRSDQGTRCLTT